MMVEAGKPQWVRQAGKREAQAGVKAIVQRQNFFDRKPQFLLLRP